MYTHIYTYTYIIIMIQQLTLIIVLLGIIVAPAPAARAGYCFAPPGPLPPGEVFVVGRLYVSALCFRLLLDSLFVLFIIGFNK